MRMTLDFLATCQDCSIDVAYVGDLFRVITLLCALSTIPEEVLVQRLAKFSKYKIEFVSSCASHFLLHRHYRSLTAA